jgi:hypothetical protein
MDAPKHIADLYLGDGVYASFDGYHIILDLREQDSTTRIALEPAVLKWLDRYRQNVRDWCDAQHARQQAEAEEALHDNDN